MPKRPPKPPDRELAPRVKGKKSAAVVDPVEPSLTDLIRENPTQEELKLAYDEIDKQKSHRAAAILAAAFVEDAIRHALKAKFVPLANTEYEDVFGVGGPVSSFSSAINLGYALGLYGKEAKSDLHAIRRVRNAFAHAMKPISFDTPQIAKEVNKLTYIDWKRKGGEVIAVVRTGAPVDNEHRQRYADHCRVLIYEVIGQSLGWSKTGCLP